MLNEARFSAAMRQACSRGYHWCVATVDIRS
jgi:hypothetical protein